MTSLFTRFVARGVEVPVIDRRLLTHVEFSEVVSVDDGQAAPTEDDLSVATEVQLSD